MAEHYWWPTVEQRLSAFQSEHSDNLPGAAFGVETREGRDVSAVGSNWKTDTICEIGSMTKPFLSAALLLALEERNMLDIERFVWQLPGMQAYATHPLGSRIRLRHLLQHTSGLPHFARREDWPRTPCNDPEGNAPGWLGPRLSLGPTSDWIGAPGLTNELMLGDEGCQPCRQLSLDQVSAYIMQTYPIAESPGPGAAYSYSTVNYVLVARIIEHLTHQSFNRYIHDRLLRPLDMDDSFFIAQPTGDPVTDAWLDDGVSEQQRARIASLTLITRDGHLPVEMAGSDTGQWDQLRRGWRFPNSDGGMYSTVNDLLNFLSALRDEGTFKSRRVLSPEVVHLLVEDQGFGHTMGFGFRSQQTPYGQAAGTVEHMGYKMTYFWYEPNAGNPLIGVFLSQRLANVAVNTNLGDGMHVIFRVFVPAARGEWFAALQERSAQRVQA